MKMNTGDVWRRVARSRGGRIELSVLAVGTLLLAGIGVSQTIPANADDDKLEGEAVPTEIVPAIVDAALSCNTLTPSRVAAQIMMVSGFSDAGGQEVAGLNDAEWKKWKPSAEARRTDKAANIVALGHHMCQLVGELRVARVGGDPWRAALAADQVGLPAVIEAGGVPETAKAFVDKTEKYANWYADQDLFKPVGGDDPTSLPQPDAGPHAVPAELVAGINAAGRICPSVTPPRIAAQLFAASQFNPNLRSSDGAAGIAQFEPGMWDRYKPSKTASLWDPNDAIPALGSAMCDISNQLAGLGGDTWQLALGAFQWGPKLIRQAGGVPRINVEQLADVAQSAVSTYEKDPRLTAEVSPPPSSQSPSPKPTKPTQPPSPTPDVQFEPRALYQIQNLWAGTVLDLPGEDTPELAPGAKVQLWQRIGPQPADAAGNRGKDQLWMIVPVDDGFVRIVNHIRWLPLAIKDDVLVVDALKDDDPNGHWKIKDDGDGQMFIVNRQSGKALDLAGDDAGPAYRPTWNGTQIGQWDLEDHSRDQRWLFIKS